jgi:hypothetical protein
LNVSLAYREKTGIKNTKLFQATTHPDPARQNVIRIFVVLGNGGIPENFK